MNSSIFFSKEILHIVNEEISFKENTKHITKFLKLLKNANYRKKISKHFERNICECTIEVFNFTYRKKKYIYNTADEVVDMQAVNFVLMKHN